MQDLICALYLSHRRSGLTNSSNRTEHFDVGIGRSKLKQAQSFCTTFVVWQAKVIPFFQDECFS